MTKKYFAHKVLQVTPRYWSMVIKGERNLSFSRAKTASGLIGSSSDLWMNPEAVATERQSAWESFQRRVEA